MLRVYQGLRNRGRYQMYSWMRAHHIAIGWGFILFAIGLTGGMVYLLICENPADVMVARACFVIPMTLWLGIKYLKVEQD